MKSYPLIFTTAACVLVLTTVACSPKKTQPDRKLQGIWKSKDGLINLKITDKQFTLDNEPEDYFTKGDTIFTSFEGNLPYTKFLIQKLDEKQLSLMFPDSVSVEFSR
jgi:hypothetical protein